MLLLQEFAHLINETSIVVDNAKKPAHSATEAALPYPILCRYQKPHVREKRMIHKRSTTMNNRWESVPVNKVICECFSQDQTKTSYSTKQYPAMNLVHLTAMPLRMPVRSRDDYDILPLHSLATKGDEPSSLINFLDEALAISDMLDYEKAIQS